MAISLKLSVNGMPVTVNVEPHTLLVQLLRKHLCLTDMHVGCDTAQYDVCTVHIDGRAAKSCSIPTVRADGAEVTVTEGLSRDGALHPIREAFRQCRGLQCGFRTSDMVMTATALAAQHPHPDGHTVREQLDGNLYRCMGYYNIVHAVMRGAEAMAEVQSNDASLQSLAATRAHAA